HRPYIRGITKARLRFRPIVAEMAQPSALSQRISITFNRCMRGVMKKSLITGASSTGAMLGTLIAGGAMAADMAVKAPIMRAPLPAFSWTGCYLDAGVGYGIWNQDHN